MVGVAGKATAGIGIYFPSAQKETSDLQQSPAPSSVGDPCKPLLAARTQHCQVTWSCWTSSWADASEHSNVIPIHWWDYWFLHAFWVVTYLAKKHPRLVAGEHRQPSWGYPGVKGRKVRALWLVRRLKWKCSVAQSCGADSGTGARRTKVVEGFGGCGDTVWLICSELWLHYTGSTMGVSALQKELGKKGPSGTGTIRGKTFEVL